MYQKVGYSSRAASKKAKKTLSRAAQGSEWSKYILGIFSCISHVFLHYLRIWMPLKKEIWRPIRRKNWWLIRTWRLILSGTLRRFSNAKTVEEHFYLNHSRDISVLAKLVDLWKQERAPHYPVLCLEEETGQDNLWVQLRQLYLRPKPLESEEVDKQQHHSNNN